MQAARDPCPHRPCRKPHFRPASMVPGSLPQSAIKVSGLVCVVEEKAERRRIWRRFSGGAKVHLELREDGQGVLISSLLCFSARPQYNPSRGAGRDSEDYGLLV